MSINGNSPTVDDVYDVLDSADGKHPILLHINAGEKGPRWGGWSKITYEESLTPAYQSLLYSKANTGVLLGVTDDLCAIDCDTHAFLAEFLRLNPEFEKTLRTRGGSGGQLWAYVTGERPHQIHDLAVKKDSPLAIGTRKKANADGNISIGEFRAEGGQSVIRGIHPSSFNYTWPVVAHPITIDFDSIQWPNDVELPWVPKRPSAKKNSADETLLQRAIVRLTINFLWDHFGYPERTRNPVRSPWFPDDKDTSFSIYNQGRNFKDHDPGRPTHRGDSFDFYQLATGKTTGEAFKEFVELAGLGGELKNAHTSPAPSPAPLCDVVRRLAIYYDPERGSFWKPDDRDIWIKISETGIARHLAEAGFDPQKPKGGAISQVGRILNKIQLSMNVEYADSLAGYRKGITEFAGKRLLILDSPKLIEPVPGDHRIVGTFLYNLLGNEQLTYLHGWLKVSIETQRNQSLRPGQALVLTGEKDCGKSLLQKLITLLLGGRMAKPYLYMSGQTPFNGNLSRAEHLSIEDEQPFTDIRSRRNFGAKIKEITAIDDQNCHFKFRNGLTLPVFWRLTISLNDETENLLMLPPLDDSLEDKLTIFKVQKHPMPMPTATDEERKKFYDTLVSELPAYVDFLLNDWTIPPHLVSQRYGITHYHNPKILERLGELAPETRLLQLIDAEIFKPNAPIPRTAPWEGSGLELENALRTYPSVVHAQAKELFTWPGACGTYLGRLQKSHPKRIFYKRTKREGRRWIVNPPSP